MRAVGGLLVEDVSVHFGGVAAVQGASFAVPAGQVTALVGPNGAGKTTLLNAISGVAAIQTGRISVADVMTNRLAPFQRARLGIGRTFQTPVLVESATVTENVMMGVSGGRLDYIGCLTGLSRRKDRDLRSRALRALAFAGLEPLADEPASRLPHGQRKLVELARALVAEPSLLLLDEPASGLHDTEVAMTVDAVAGFAERGGAVLLVEHHMGLVRRVAHDVVVLDFGRVIARGTPDEIAANERVITAYLGSERL